MYCTLLTGTGTNCTVVTGPGTGTNGRVLSSSDRY